MDRPRPPESIDAVELGDQFVSAPEIVDWALATFVNEGAALENPERAHLLNAHIGALWTNVANRKSGRSIVGQCETGDPMPMGKWADAKARIQVEQWFGQIPDFILTSTPRIQTDVVNCTSGTSFAARVKNLNNKQVNVHKATVRAAA